jgi:hypothetical protein
VRSGCPLVDPRGSTLCPSTFAAQARQTGPHGACRTSVEVERGIEFGQDEPFEVHERIGCGERVHGDLEVCAHPISQPLLGGVVEVSSVDLDELELIAKDRGLTKPQPRNASWTPPSGLCSVRSARSPLMTKMFTASRVKARNKHLPHSAAHSDAIARR